MTRGRCILLCEHQQCVILYICRSQAGHRPLTEPPQLILSKLHMMYCTEHVRKHYSTITNEKAEPKWTNKISWMLQGGLKNQVFCFTSPLFTAFSRQLLCPFFPPCRLYKITETHWGVIFRSASWGSIKAASDVSRCLCKWVSQLAGSGAFFSTEEDKLQENQQNYDRMDI